MFRKALSLAALFGLGCAYRIAMVNDIHLDLNYNPSSGSCISKVFPAAV